MIEFVFVYCCSVMCFSAAVYKASAKIKNNRNDEKEKYNSNKICKENLLWIANELRL